MIVELISTGSELLLGDTVNTNVSWLAQELNKLGYTIAHQSVVGDNPKRMAEVFQLAVFADDNGVNLLGAAVLVEILHHQDRQFRLL